jgi:hypothetical protein
VDLLIALIVLVLIGVVALMVSAPLRRAHTRGLPSTMRYESGAARDELEAAREAKYREIRDAELDFCTGKLSREDYEAIDARLRAEAIEILDRLERVTSRDA